MNLSANAKSDSERIIALTKALEFYADESNYTCTLANSTRNVYLDRGKAARTALAIPQQGSALPHRQKDSIGIPGFTTRPTTDDGIGQPDTETDQFYAKVKADRVNPFGRYSCNCGCRSFLPNNHKYECQWRQRYFGNLVFSGAAVSPGTVAQGNEEVRGDGTDESSRDQSTGEEGSVPNQ